MPLIRGHHSFDDHFTQIPNDWLRDKTISLGAKGLIAQLLSHAPGWRISQESLARDNGIGRDAIRTLINELLNAGYLMRSEDRERTEKGYLGGYTYTTQDPTQDNPTQDNPLHKNNNIKNKILKNNERIYSDSKNEFDSFWSHYPKKVDKGAAVRAFRKALKTYPANEVIEGAKRYAEDPNLPEKQFIKNPATWLNAESWDNGPLPARKKTDRKALEEWAND
jgi:predicted DNA-binding transcriptional regulator